MNFANSKSWCYRYRVTLSIIFTILPLSIGIYSQSGNLKARGISLSVSDWLQLLGQLGTFGAFGLAYIQMKISRQDAFKAEQNALAAAANRQIEKMFEELKNFDPKATAPEYICDFVNKMNNFAGNLQRISSKVILGDPKDSIVGEWQDMWFNELVPKMQRLSIGHVIGHNMDHVDIALAAAYALKQQELKLYQPPYRRYFEALHILEFLGAKIPAQTREQFTEDSSSLYLFKFHYFKQENIDSLLAGTMNIADFRIHAPVLAALLKHYGSEYFEL